jgi:TPR repeat protein
MGNDLVKNNIKDYMPPSYTFQQESPFCPDALHQVKNLFVTQINNKPLAEIACDITTFLNDHFVSLYTIVSSLFLNTHTLTPLSRTLLGFLFEYNETTINEFSIQELKHSYFDLYLMAAEQNFALAQYFVGRCYMCCVKGVDKINLAIEYFEKSGKSGNARAQFEMAVYYEHFIGDLRKALYWYKESEKNGFYQARYSLGHLYKDDMKSIGRDIHRAIYFFRKSIHKRRNMCSQLLEIFQSPYSMEEDFSRW